MSPRDFCFWLMGAFELAGSKRSLLACEKSTKEIREHLSLVFADTSTTYQQTYPDDCLGINFCHWLNKQLGEPGSKLTLMKLDRTFECLSTVFINEIDPSFSNSSQLQDIHDGRDISSTSR